MAEEKNMTLKKSRLEMDYLTGDAAVRRLAELREKWEMDRVSELDYAETKGREEGKKEGLLEGKKEGKKEGLLEGKREGKKEEQIEIAKEMLKNNMDFELISRITKLSLDEVKDLGYIK